MEIILKSSLEKFDFQTIEHEMARVNNQCAKIFENSLKLYDELKICESEADKVVLLKKHDELKANSRLYNKIRTPLTQTLGSISKLYTSDESYIKKMGDDFMSEVNEYENKKLQQKLKEKEKMQIINDFKFFMNKGILEKSKNKELKLITYCKNLTKDNLKKISSIIANFDCEINFTDTYQYPEYQYYSKSEVVDIINKIDRIEFNTQQIEGTANLKEKKMKVIAWIEGKEALYNSENQIYVAKIDIDNQNKKEVERTIQNSKKEFEQKLQEEENKFAKFQSEINDISINANNIAYELPANVSKKDIAKMAYFFIESINDIDKLKKSFAKQIDFCLKFGGLFEQEFPEIKLIKKGIYIK